MASHEGYWINFAIAEKMHWWNWQGPHVCWLGRAGVKGDSLPFSKHQRCNIWYVLSRYVVQRNHFLEVYKYLYSSISTISTQFNIPNSPAPMHLSLGAFCNYSGRVWWQHLWSQPWKTWRRLQYWDATYESMMCRLVPNSIDAGLITWRKSP